MANEQNDRTKTTPAGAPAKIPPVSKPDGALDSPGKMSGTGNGADTKDPVTGLYEHAKDTASGSYDAVATKAKSSIEQRKNELSSGLKTVADSVREVGGQLRTKGEPN